MTPSSAVEFLIWLLIAEAIIAMLAKLLRIPYTVSLVLGGLLLGAIHLPLLSPLQPGQRPDWLTPDVILIVFLLALVFEGSVKLDVQELLRNSVPLLLLANVGVLIAAFTTGYLVYWLIGLPLLIALVFGSIISATDPISVLAIFKDLRIGNRLSVLMEGESLLNGSTGARSGSELEQRVSLSRISFELDIRRGGLFHPCAGAHDQAAFKNPSAGGWLSPNPNMNV
jgi:CPA1 family monovalent cation:H+ antiporter